MSHLNQDPLPESTGGLPRNQQHEHAVFLGWQKTRSGKTYPLYNVTVKGHPYYGSTVSDTTLRRLNLDVPSTPPPHTPADTP